MKKEFWRPATQTQVATSGVQPQIQISRFYKNRKKGRISDYMKYRDFGSSKLFQFFSFWFCFPNAPNKLVPLSVFAHNYLDLME